MYRLLDNLFELTTLENIKKKTSCVISLTDQGCGPHRNQTRSWSYSEIFCSSRWVHLPQCSG